MSAAHPLQRAKRLTTRNRVAFFGACVLLAGNPAIYGFASADRRLCVPAFRQVCLSLRSILYVRDRLQTSVREPRHLRCRARKSGFCRIFLR